MLGIPCHTVSARPPGTAALPTGSDVSCVFQPSDGRLHYLVQTGQLFLQISLAAGREGVGLAAVIGANGANPAALFEAGDRPVERSRPQPYVSEALDVLHHGIA